MADTSLIIGNGNWAVKETSLLGYNIIQSKYVPIDMTVVRATTATRVNSAGLIELVPRNLLTYSEQFDNAGWTKTNVTVTANATTAPNGTFTADKLTITTTLGVHQINRLSVVASSQCAMSIYAKADGVNTFTILDGTGSYGSVFNLSTETVTNLGTGVGTMVSVGDGWYRCITIVTTTGFRLYCPNSSSSAGDGTSGIYIWGAQLETGTTATEYFPTTDRFNIPRVDYSTGTASLLVEPARTNSVLYSEEFSNASWNTASTSTVTLNAGIAPSGNNTANLITATSVDGRRIQSVSLTAGTYTYSYFVKKGNQSSIQVLAFNSTLSAVAQTADFNLDSGTLTSGTGIIQQFTNGWYRVSVTFTIVLTNTIFLYIKSGLNNNAIGSTVLAWGGQLEAGSNATSYIPTVAATVTRNADLISKTGISSLINSEEGVLYAEISALSNASGSKMISLSDGTTNNNAYIYYNGNTIYADFNSSGVASANMSFVPTSVLNFNKIALKYKLNDFALWVNGVKVAFDTSGSVPSSGVFNQLKLSRNSNLDPFIGNVKSVLVFPTALTDTQLATLTTI